MNRKQILEIAFRINDSLSIDKKKSDQLIIDTVNDIENNYSNVDFGDYSTIYLRNSVHKREIKVYEPLSMEQILIYYIKEKLSNHYSVKFPNRNEYISSFFDIVKSLKGIRDFTVIKVDFKDFFNSISLTYFYNYIIKDSNLDRDTKDLLYKYSEECKFSYAGIPASNIVSEIISKEFDRLVNLYFNDRGLIFYRRYVDDCILVFNEYISKANIFKELNNIINQVYFMKFYEVKKENRVKFNFKKTKYVARRNLKIGNLCDIDYLGYTINFEISQSNCLELKYGLSKDKIKKYTRYMEHIVDEYLIDKNVELLRHRVILFCRRTVYQSERNGKTYWISKGIVSNYIQLHKHNKLLTKSTEEFLKTIVLKVFVKKCKSKLPYFMKDTQQSNGAYSLFGNLTKNRALIFHERIGVSKSSLTKMCKQIRVNLDLSRNYSYEVMLKEYLIKIGVGY